MHRHPAVHTAAREPSVSVSRLLGKMAASLATGLLEMVGDMLTSRKRISDSYERIGSTLVIVAAMTIQDVRERPTEFKAQAEAIMLGQTTAEAAAEYLTELGQDAASMAQ